MMESHKDSGERCCVAHFDKYFVLQEPCIRCLKCRQWIRPEDFNKECTGMTQEGK